MYRTFYNAHSDTESRTCFHFLNDAHVSWILDTKTHQPQKIKTIDADENWLLFRTKDQCTEYYR